MQQVELDVAPAPHELLVALRIAPLLLEIAPDDLRVDAAEGAPDILRKGERGFPAAGRRLGREVVVEDAADAARLLAVRQIKILVAPRLEARVVDDGVRRAGLLHGGMEVARVGIFLRAPRPENGRQVGAAAEPPFRRHDETRVHVHGRHVRILQVGNERNARGPEAGVFRCAGNLRAEFGGELTIHGRRVDADLLEDAPAHHAHEPAATIAARMVAAPPLLARKAARGAIR